MKNKILFIPLICFAVFFTGCKDKAQTLISITVKNNAGEIQPNVLVYEFESPAADVYGSNPMYANKSKLTNEQGIAVFTIDGFEYNEGSNEASLYFTVIEKKDAIYTIKGTVNLKIKDGEVLSETLYTN